MNLPVGTCNTFLPEPSAPQIVYSLYTERNKMLGAPQGATLCIQLVHKICSFGREYSPINPVVEHKGTGLLLARAEPHPGTSRGVALGLDPREVSPI